MLIPASSRIYIAPYHAAKGDLTSSPCGSSVAVFKKIVARGDWPLDYGDDPSFYAMKEFEGPLSWGVCRQDVRNRLRSGDMLVFFSYLKCADNGSSEYRLCALATVEISVSQKEIWEDPKLKKFRRYFNLLIKPGKPTCDSWEHYEPTVKDDRYRIHGDWLWRICYHRGLSKKDFEEVEKTNRFDSKTHVRRLPLLVARNYVLFSTDSDKTCVLSRPPIVALHSKGRAVEEWKADRFSQRIRELTLGCASRANGKNRSLRIRNSQRAHRHIVFELPSREAEDWRRRFMNFIRRR